MKHLEKSKTEMTEVAPELAKLKIMSKQFD